MSFRSVYGYTVSENGWRMVNRDECGIVKIPGLSLVDTAPLRVGSTLTILGAWLYWYDRNVEEILTPVWGWSLTNDVGNSNHLSGTAVDVCAPKYPWKQWTMPADRVAKVKAGLKLFEGTVYWGRTWGEKNIGSVDEMHYQMAFPEGDPRNDAFAKKLLNGYLGIYKKETPPVIIPPSPPEEDRFPNDWTDREIQIETLRQLRGFNLTGWDQLNGKSLIDSLALLHQKMDQVNTKLDQLLKGTSDAV